MATHSSILAWEIPWTEEPGPLGSQRDRQNLATKTTMIFIILISFRHHSILNKDYC